MASYNEVDEIENMKSIYPNIEYVASVWVIQDENDLNFDVRVWDEWADCSDESLERVAFSTWESAQKYIETLYLDYPNVYFNRLFDMDAFVSGD